jgi:hypothetical protein
MSLSVQLLVLLHFVLAFASRCYAAIPCEYTIYLMSKLKYYSFSMLLLLNVPVADAEFFLRSKGEINLQLISSSDTKPEAD